MEVLGRCNRAKEIAQWSQHMLCIQKTWVIFLAPKQRKLNQTKILWSKSLKHLFINILLTLVSSYFKSISNSIWILVMNIFSSQENGQDNVPARKAMQEKNVIAASLAIKVIQSVSPVTAIWLAV